MIPSSLYIKVLFEVMIKSITNFLIFFIFQQLRSQISKIDQNGYNPFCDETLQIMSSRDMIKDNEITNRLQKHPKSYLNNHNYYTYLALS